MMNGARERDSKKDGKKEQPERGSRMKQALRKLASALMIEKAVLGLGTAATALAGCGGEEFATEQKIPIPGKDAQGDVEKESEADAKEDAKPDAGPDAKPDQEVEAGEDANLDAESGPEADVESDAPWDVSDDAPLDAADDAMDSGEDALEAGEDALDAKDAAEDGPQEADAPADSGIVCDNVSATSVTNGEFPRNTVTWHGGYGVEYLNLPYSSDGINVSLHCKSGGVDVVLEPSQVWVADGTSKEWNRSAQDGLVVTFHLDHASNSIATGNFTSALPDAGL